MVYAQPIICPREWDTQTTMGLWHTKGSLYFGLMTRPYNNQRKKKRRTCRIEDLAVPADHRIKLKESKKTNKHLNLAWEFQKLWNMKVTVIPIVIDSLGTDNKGLLKGVKDFETRGLGNKRTGRDHPNYCIIEKSPEDLRRLALTQTPVKDNQL